MKKLANIAMVLSVYVAGWFAARYLLSSEYARVAPEIAKWMWGLGALLIGILGQLSWKVHEVKRVEGLETAQRAKVRKVAGLISLRIFLIGLAIFFSSVVGFASSYVQRPAVAHHMTHLSLGVMLASAFICVFLVPLMQRDIQRFEDAAREEFLAKKAAESLAAKLKNTTGSAASTG